MTLISVHTRNLHFRNAPSIVQNFWSKFSLYWCQNPCFSWNKMQECLEPTFSLAHFQHGRERLISKTTTPPAFHSLQTSASSFHWVILALQRFSTIFWSLILLFFEIYSSILFIYLAFPQEFTKYYQFIYKSCQFFAEVCNCEFRKWGLRPLVELRHFFFLHHIFSKINIHLESSGA